MQSGLDETQGVLEPAHIELHELGASWANHQFVGASELDCLIELSGLFLFFFCISFVECTLQSSPFRCPCYKNLLEVCHSPLSLSFSHTEWDAQDEEACTFVASF